MVLIGKIKIISKSVFDKGTYEYEVYETKKKKTIYAIEYHDSIENQKGNKCSIMDLASAYNITKNDPEFIWKMNKKIKKLIERYATVEAI